MQREMERLLGYLGSSKPPAAHFAPMVWEPAVDIYETEKEIVVVLELAGVRQEEIKVAIERNVLVVKGERKETSARSRKSYYQMEIHRGSFEKVITLPSPVDSGQTKAFYEEGLLRIVLPKTQREQTLRLRVKK
jgi:HSP20 family protein